MRWTKLREKEKKKTDLKLTKNLRILLVTQTQITSQKYPLVALIFCKPNLGILLSMIPIAKIPKITQVIYISMKMQMQKSKSKRTKNRRMEIRKNMK